MIRSIASSQWFRKKSIAAAVLLLASPLVRAQAVSVTGGSTVTVDGIISTTSNFVSGYGLFVTNGGTATGSADISTAGSNAQAVYVSYGGNVKLSDSSVATTGSQSPAVHALFGNATAALDNTVVTTSGNWSHGIEASDNSTIMLQDGSVNTSGQNAYGLYAIGTGSNLTATGITVSTSGNNSIGAYNQGGGLITLDDVSIVTAGSNARGVQIGAQGVVGNGTTENVIQISNSTVTTTGDNSTGLLASDNATLNAANVGVLTSGASSFGAAALFGAQMQLKGGSVSTSGDDAWGLVVAGMPATSGDVGTTAPSITASGLTISTSGQNAPAAYVAGGTNLSAADSTLKATGAGSDVVYGAAYDTTAAASASFADSTLESAQANGLHASGAALSVSLDNSTVTAGNHAMIADSGATLNVVADGSTLTGTADVDSASTLDATLQNSSIWNVTGASNVSSLTLDNGTVRYLGPAQLNAGGVTLGANGGIFDTGEFDAALNAAIAGTGSLRKTGTGTLTLSGENTYSGNTTVSAGTLQAGSAGAFSAMSGFAVAGGAMLDLNGFSQTVAGVSNSGTVHFGTTAGTTLTVTGDYAGNDGRLVMNTALGDSSSVTDLLHVQGSTSGNTGVQIVNAQGLGALTTGDGIKVIQVDGISGGTFTQSAQIEAGAYVYTLYKGGTGSNATNGNWYLRSTLESQSSSSEASTADDSSSTDHSGSAPAGDNLTTQDAPAIQSAPIAYRPGTVGYVMTPQLNANLGFSMLGTLHRRVGDVPGAAAPQNTGADGVWGRIEGQTLQADAISRFSADSRSMFVQFGKDWTFARDAAGGSTHAGVTLNFGSASADFSDRMRSIVGLGTATGTVETQTQGFGGYWTRYFTDGAYADSVIQFNHYHNRYGDITGNTAGQNGFGVAVSEELGKAFQVARLPVAFEPQIQLAYQYLNLKGFNDNVSAISGTTTHALRGRIGFRLLRSDMENATKSSALTPYFTANLLRDFISPGQTVVGGTPIDTTLSRTWLDVGLGFTVSYGKHGNLYASARYEHNLGGERRRGVSGNMGVRYMW
ncbi:autotransporter outer membrane beta-barrel domain-containing protein [Burkholderia ubonensis]|uniref:autotransporter family protein n=1 Tax=Burkholderia ubonensis TaxID=101571 RepID=UPI0009B3AEF6|nr:autotransporter outer membrane beta-barrel domain-containing protein [Burkholderia ubonensis]